MCKKRGHQPVVLRGVVGDLRGGLWEEVNPWGCALEGDIGAQPPSYFVSQGPQVNKPPPPMASTQAQSTGATGHGMGHGPLKL